MINNTWQNDKQLSEKMFNINKKKQKKKQFFFYQSIQVLPSTLV